MSYIITFVFSQSTVLYLHFLLFIYSYAMTEIKVIMTSLVRSNDDQ